MKTVLTMAVTLAVIASVGTAVVGNVAPVSAQARLVNALVRTFPARPAPGDDVTVVVGVTGCPTGPVTVEIYLTTSDGASQTSTLMARAAATTNLVFRTRAVLLLPAAVQGWYGARVLCGTFRPPKVPMTNTLFAVGAKHTNESTLGAESVAPGGSVPFSGTGCPGSKVEYDISQGAGWPGAFVADGTIPVNPDGTWLANLAFPTEITPGPALVRARCVLTNRYDDTIYVYYGDTTELQVERPPAAAAAPPR